MSAYADASFLVSLYIPDVNSAAAARATREAALPILITPLTEVEIINAIQLRIFRKELSGHEARSSTLLFQEDLASGVLALKPLTITMFERAKQMARKRSSVLGTRTLDLLHVACAVVLQANRLLTFDYNQEKLAKMEGLKTP
ncbi:MAG TPA: type II toxin-antitoxin system VapC family toxin [Terriglobales bacterium]|nr:type II toxin-antitoxin system VapC family toxin [Terriglobales bacterium]